MSEVSRGKGIEAFRQLSSNFRHNFCGIASAADKKFTEMRALHGAADKDHLVGSSITGMGSNDRWMLESLKCRDEFREPLDDVGRNSFRGAQEFQDALATSDFGPGQVGFASSSCANAIDEEARSNGNPIALR